MRLIFPLLLIIFVNHPSRSQYVAVHDGIRLEVSAINRPVFYYGEPLLFYFNAINTRNTNSAYYYPQHDVNYRFSLKNLGTNDITEEGGWRDLGHMRGVQQSSPPAENQAFQPRETHHLQVLLNNRFGSEKLANVTYHGNALEPRLRAIPVGQYELKLYYHLFPSEEVLSVSYNFEVKEVPIHEKEAFQQFIKTTAYACDAHYRGEGNYSKQHPDSYENFLKQYPNSIYSDYALFDMVVEIYTRKGPSASDREKAYQAYMNYFPNIKSNGVKVSYVRALPLILRNQPNINIKEYLDQFLKEKLIHENPDISDVLISATSQFTQIKGLKNYAKEKQEIKK